MSKTTPEQKLAALGLTLPTVPRSARQLRSLSLGRQPSVPLRPGTEEARRNVRDRATWQGRHGRRRLPGGAPHRPAIVGGRQVGDWRTHAHRGGGQAARHGQRRARLRRSPQSHQRLLRPLCRNAWRSGSPRSLSGRDGLAPQRHHGRDRSHFADPILTRKPPLGANAAAMRWRAPNRYFTGAPVTKSWT